MDDQSDLSGLRAKKFVAFKNLDMTSPFVFLTSLSDFSVSSVFLLCLVFGLCKCNISFCKFSEFCMSCTLYYITTSLFSYKNIYNISKMHLQNIYYFNWKHAVRSYVPEIFPGNIQSKSSQKWNVHQNMLEILFSYTTKTYVCKKSFKNSAEILLRFLFTNLSLDIFQWICVFKF